MADKPVRDDEFKLAIEKAVIERMRFINSNRERLIEAFIAETGLRPSECELVERHSTDEVIVFIRRRTIDGKAGE